MKRNSLRLRVTFGLLVYAAVLTVALVIAATILGEKRERAAWQALLSEVLEYDSRNAGSLPESEFHAPVRTIDLDSTSDTSFPEAIRRLGPGLHVRHLESGQPYAVLVQLMKGHRYAALVDISGHERAERRLLIGTLAVAGAAFLGLLFATWWWAGRLLRPVTELGAQVRALDPARRGGRVETSYQQEEVVTIELAVNAFLEQLDAFVVREREFIDTVSHELRTPITVIAGATEVLADVLAPGARGRTALDRIRATVNGMQETVTTLLYLAKDPSRFAPNERFRLDQLLPTLVHEHEALLAGRDMEIQLHRLEPTELLAPSRIASIAIGNLLRNAIEHVSAGIVRVSLVDGVVEVQDDGAGVDAATISRLYRAQVTGTRPPGSGIGLYVIGRICERLGWRLNYEAGADGGTCGRLDVTASVVAPSAIQ